MKVGDFVVERLHAWGVRRIYGYPGDGINGVIGALQRAEKIEVGNARGANLQGSCLTLNSSLCELCRPRPRSAFSRPTPCKRPCCSVGNTGCQCLSWVNRVGLPLHR